MKQFSMTHLVFDDRPPEKFDESSAPDWLTSVTYRWFWENHVLTLKVGQTIETDFRSIMRIQ